MTKRKQFSKVLGNELKSIRYSLDLTMAEISEKLSISQPVINYYEKGQRIPSIETLRVYSDTCNIDFEHLFNLRVRCIKESYDTFTDDANFNLKNEYELIMYYENKLNKKE